MRNYFGFNLTGKKLFPVWISFLISFAIPYAALIMLSSNIQPGTKPSPFILPILLLLMLVAFVFSYYFTKLAIENISYKEKTIVFNGTFGKYLLKLLLGLFLTIITLGIYMAWFIRDLNRFFVNHSSYEQENLQFNGKAGKLFWILALTLLVPIIVMTSVIISYAIAHKDHPAAPGMFFPLAMLIVMIPYIYCVYKWYVNISYRSYHIVWETNFWNSCGKIALEMFLSIITLGIYIPLATIRLYKYFISRTVAVADDRKLTFGYEIEPLNDFLFIWGQTLLTIITLFIYHPWAYCKVRSRILSKTYLEQNQENF